MLPPIYTNLKNASIVGVLTGAAVQSVSPAVRVDLSLDEHQFRTRFPGGEQ